VARTKPRSYVVRMDRDLWVDPDFAEMTRSARLAYMESLIHLAGISQPEGTYPWSALAKSVGPEADEVAGQVTEFGIWTPVDEGFKVIPYGGWRVVPEFPPSRPYIPVRIRRAVMARDGRACVLCGATKHLALDHIYPWSLGGPDTVENLRVLCRSCNSRKGARV
jgi:hypothetical protein